MYRTVNHWYPVPNRHTIPGGRLDLGTVLKHPKKPFAALTTLGKQMNLPTISIRNEEHRGHVSTIATPISGSLTAKVLDFLNISSNVSRSEVKTVKVEGLDLEMRSFTQGFDKPTCERIGSIPAVEKHMRGFFRPNLLRRPVFIVTGLLIARSKPQVASGTKKEASLSASANVTVSPIPEAMVTVGGHASGGNMMTEEDIYTGDMDIVVGYELDIIRPGLNGLEAEAFMEGAEFACVNGQEEEDDDEDEQTDGEDDDDILRCLPLTVEELENIPNDNSKFTIEKLHGGHFWVEFMDDDTDTSSSSSE